MNPKIQTAMPSIYWVTDPNPARALQTGKFSSWLVKCGHTEASVNVDAANNDLSKKIIQGVSGVLGDTCDCGTGGGELIYFCETGIVEDVTDAGLQLGFAPSNTFPQIKDDIVIDGRQYAFPCNLYNPMLLANLDSFGKVGMEPPPLRWSFEEFERMGREYVKRANEGRSRHDMFFCSSFHERIAARSLGYDIFNETLTAACGKAEINAKAYEMLYRWIYVENLMPTAAQQASFSTQGGYGGAELQLFNSGNYAMVFTGRHALIQMREFGSLKLDLSEPPNGGFPNTIIGARAAFVYKGGKSKDLAKLFLAYLASEDYNMNIVEDSDGLPPNPLYTKTAAYLRPESYPNEWNVHAKFAGAAVDIAIVVSKSPYVSNSLAYTYASNAYNSVLSNIMTPDQAAQDLIKRIDAEIARTLKENPKLQSSYNADCELQSQIECRLKAGEKIPAAWLKNPFHKKYYKDMGLLE